MSSIDILRDPKITYGRRRNSSERAVLRHSEEDSSTEDDHGDPFDRVFDEVGDFGKAQMMILAVLFYANWIPSMQTVIAIWTQDTPNYSCQTEDGRLTEVFEERCNRTTVAQCGVNGAVCANYTYDTTQYESTLVTEFDLVCENERINTALKSLFYVGFVIGALICGFFADNYGRRTTLIGVTIVGFLSDMLVSYTHSLYVYGTFRVIAGSCGIMAGITGFCMMMEFTGRSWRTRIGIFNNGLGFACGFTLAGVLAYFIRDWRTLHFAMTCAYAPLLIGLYLIPESPRWLATNDRVDEAIAILEGMAKRNGKKCVELPWIHNISIGTTNTVQYTMIDVFRQSRYMTKTTILLQLVWASCAWIGYGITLSCASLPGSSYVNNAIIAFIPCPLFCITPWLLENPKIGRRWTAFWLFMTSAMFCLGATITNEMIYCIKDQTDHPLVLLNIAFAFLGRMMISGMFTMTWFWSAELFPTPIRGTGQGVTSAAARLATVSTPVIIAMQSTISWFPGIFMTVVGFIAAFVALNLSETAGVPMLQTFDDADRLYRKKR